MHYVPNVPIHALFNLNCINIAYVGGESKLKYISIYVADLFLENKI